MLRTCAVFSILAGLVGVAFCIGFTLLAIGLGGSGSVTWKDYLDLGLLIGPIGVAGVLYCGSGVTLWRSLPSVRRITVVLLGWVLGFLLAHCIQFIAVSRGRFGPGGEPRQAGDPFDEEVVLFLFVPMAMLLLAAIQFEYLRRRAKRPS